MSLAVLRRAFPNPTEEKRILIGPRCLVLTEDERVRIIACSRIQGLQDRYLHLVNTDPMYAPIRARRERDIGARAQRMMAKSDRDAERHIKNALLEEES